MYCTISTDHSHLVIKEEYTTKNMKKHDLYDEGLPTISMLNLFILYHSIKQYHSAVIEYLIVWEYADDVGGYEHNAIIGQKINKNETYLVC